MGGMAAGVNAAPPAERIRSHPIRSDTIAIGTGAGLLAAHTRQLAGRRPASAADLRRGYPGLAGAQLG